MAALPYHQGDKEREYEREQTNDFFINEGKEISTIYFFHPAHGQKQNNNNKNNWKQNNYKLKNSY